MVMCIMRPAAHYQVCIDSPFCPCFIPIQLTEQEALTVQGVRTKACPTHPRGEFALGQWDGWAAFCQVGTGFSPIVWSFGQEMSSWGQWEHGSTRTDRTGRGGRWVVGMGQFGCTNEGSHGTDHCCPMAPSVFWGAWKALWLGKLGPSLAVGFQDLSQVRENKGVPCHGLLHRCAKF